MRKKSNKVFDYKNSSDIKRIDGQHRKFLKRFNSASKYKSTLSDDALADDDILDLTSTNVDEISHSEPRNSKSTTSIATHGYEFLEEHTINDDYSEDFERVNEPKSSTYEPTLNQSTSSSAKWHSFNGRMSRTQLIAYSMLLGLVFYAITIIMVIILMPMYASAMDPYNLSVGIKALIAVFIALWLIITFYTAIVYPKRRLNDIDKSGGWLLLYLLPPISLLLLFWLYIKKGDAGANKYGMPPPPNQKWQTILAWLLPILLFFSIIVSITLSNGLVESYQQKASVSDTVPIGSKDTDSTDNDSLDNNSALPTSTNNENENNNENTADGSLYNPSVNNQSNNNRTSTNQETIIISGDELNNIDSDKDLADMINNKASSIETDKETSTELKGPKSNSNELNSNELNSPDLNSSAIDNKVQSGSNNDSVDDNQLNLENLAATDYYEFLRASETPLMVDKKDANQLSDTLTDDLEDIRVEPQ